MELHEGARVTFGANKTGIVRFVGETDFASGQWVGIELERPEGKNNGELNGRVYFTCAPNHGLFVKHSMIRSVVSPSPVIGSHASQGRHPLATSSSRVPDPKSRTSLPTPSTRPNASLTTSAARSRLSLDRRTTTGSSAQSGSVAKMDDQLAAAAAARIAQLEETLEQKDRQLEQLRQSVAVLKEAAAVAGTGDKTPDSIMEQEGEETLAAGKLTERVDADGDETMEENSFDTERKSDVQMRLSASPSSMQEERVHEIELIREEAEKHVRGVRAELEDHIDQLQKQLDELQHENATQASQVGTFETEVAQQKARLAAFTVAEQKKAEEVAMAVAKSSSSARKVETLTKQVAELQDMIEMVTLERETVEMDKEIAEEHAEELQQEVEKLKAGMALSATTGPDDSEPSSAGVGDLADENQKLRAAVKMLHERGSEDKAELSKKLRQAQRENAELGSLREEVEELVRDAICTCSEIEFVLRLDLC